MKSKIIYIFYLSCVVSASLFCIDFAAMKYNEKEFNTSFPYLFNIQLKTKAYAANVNHHAFNVIDPHLGTLWNSVEHENLVKNYKDIKYKPLNYRDNFVYYGDPIVKNDLVVVTLGGSTTMAPWYPSNWSEFLYDYLSEHKSKVLLYNGGMAGFTSNQELIKLIRDGLGLKPNIVIVYDGINDVGSLYSLPGHPMVSPYQKELMEYLVGLGDKHFFMPNLMYAITRTSLENKKNQPSKESYVKLAGISYGPEDNTSPVNQWIRNHRIMHTICEEFGIKYFVFLQPTMGVGNYLASSTPVEKKMYEDYIKDNDKYPDMLRDFYEGARRACGRLAYCIDLTSALDGKSGLYTDVRHINEDGNKIIASAIYRNLSKRQANKTSDK